MLYTIEDITLTALGDAVRSKVGKEAKTYNFILQGSKNDFIVELGAASKYKLSFRADIYWDNLPSSFIRIRANDVYGEQLFYQDIKASNDTEVVGELIVSCPVVYFVFSINPYLYPNAYAEITMTAIPLDENGNEFKYTPLEMIDAINALEMPDIKPIILTGSQNYGCAGELSSQYIKNFGDTITTNKISLGSNMFYNYTNESIPFELNFSSKGTTGSENISNLFSDAKNLKIVPKINNCRPSAMSYIFNGCNSLREIPEDYFDDFDWSYIETATSSYTGNMSYIFYNCYSLRKAPLHIFKHSNKNIAYSQSYFYSGFYGCYTLDELVGLPIPFTITYTSNMCNNIVSYCSRLKRLTFEMNEDGTPMVKPWKSQVLDLTKAVGYNTSAVSFYVYNSGITADKEVKDDATYAALKDDADWFTAKVEYSRYNKTSAIETINSLPDCSATGTNTIKFTGKAGEKTDGGAINTLTEAEIAVAAAKGWTVSLT
jgi:hypothetical protein